MTQQQADAHSRDIYAVIWCDFVPLHLKFKDAGETIAYAHGLRERVAALGRFMDVRAVFLAAGTDTLVDLLPREVAPKEFLMSMGVK